MKLPRLFSDDEDHADLGSELELLRQALVRPLPPGKDILAVTIHAPSEALEKFLRLTPREYGFLWHSPGGVRFAGAGATAVAEARGDDRLDRLRVRAAGVWARLHHHVRPEIDAEPVLFGGIGFAPNVPPVEPWEEFGNDLVSLPRWLYRRTGAAAYLTLCVTNAERESPGGVDAILAEARRLLGALQTESATSMIQRPNIPKSAVHHISLGEWTTYIEAILDAIASGNYEKIVAARRCVVDLDQPLEDTGFMARLFAAYPDCTHFAVRRSGATLLGATPETLFRKKGLELTTHALAGTTRVSDDPSSDSSVESAALRQSAKDLAEHALVVKRICDELRSISQRVRYASVPQSRQVRNLIHLQTPISADLRPEVHVFDLLTALHPTPAVGGFPAREAAQWIRVNEPLERGWYTGAAGWLDRNGDGEFAVMIRCGVITPKRAHIFAGAGIVDRSNPESEFFETAAKMFPILRALGVAV